MRLDSVISIFTRWRTLGYCASSSSRAATKISLCSERPETLTAMSATVLSFFSSSSAWRHTAWSSSVTRPVCSANVTMANGDVPSGRRVSASWCWTSRVRRSTIGWK